MQFLVSLSQSNVYIVKNNIFKLNKIRIFFYDITYMENCLLYSIMYVL